MMDAPANPPAFPLAVDESFQFANDGMSLRDWFAGQALAGLLANPVSFGPHMQGDPDLITSAADTFADAMLAEREKDGAK